MRYPNAAILHPITAYSDPNVTILDTIAAIFDLN